MERFPRITQRMMFLTISVGALFMGFFAGKDIFSTSYDTVPAVLLPFLIMFLTVWFGIVTACFLYGLTALQTVRLSRDEIQVCLGPVVLRRIPADRIKTVGLSVQYRKGYTAPEMFYLVLSSQTPEELNEKGAKHLKKANVRNRMFQAGIIPEGQYAAAKAYLLEHFLHAPLWMEHSEEALEALRHTLTTTVFIV